MRKWPILVALIVLIAAAISLSTHDFSPPRYQGRPVVYWLRAAFVNHGEPDVSHFGSPEALQANEAVRAIGTNAIPYYLKLLKAPDDTHSKAVVCDWIGRNISSDLYDHLLPWRNSQLIVQDAGAWGLIILGPAAKPAIPELTRMLKSGYDRANELPDLMSFLGPEAIPPITNCLSSSNLILRISAVEALQHYLQKTNLSYTNSDAEMENAAKLIVPAVMPLLADSDHLVRRTVARLLIQSPVRVNISIPTLLTAFTSPRDPMSDWARLIHELEPTAPYQKNAIAILEQISADTNSAYSSQAAAILAHVHDDSLKMSKK